MLCCTFSNIVALLFILFYSEWRFPGTLGFMAYVRFLCDLVLHRDFGCVGQAVWTLIMESEQKGLRLSWRQTPPNDQVVPKACHCRVEPFDTSTGRPVGG